MAMQFAAAAVLVVVLLFGGANAQFNFGDVDTANNNNNNSPVQFKSSQASKEGAVLFLFQSIKQYDEQIDGCFVGFCCVWCSLRCGNRQLGD